MQVPVEPQVKLSLVVPVYNEQDAIGNFLTEVNDTFNHVNNILTEVIFINDGSNDATLSHLIDLQQQYSSIKIIDLSRNFGKEAALTAGLHEAAGDVVVPIDVDLQDPPALIIEMIEKWKEGYEVVLAHRTHRKEDTLMKRSSASLFYKLHNAISYPKIPENVGDFRLMDKCVVEALKSLPESRRFMKGIFAWLGFRSITIEYDRPLRHTGQTKFSHWRLWNLALEAMTSFSTVPLRIWSYIGFVVSCISLIYASIIILKVLVYGIDVPGYASIIVAITFLGGLQLFGIGIIGEYLGRTYIESKRRPTYIVRKKYFANKE